MSDFVGVWIEIFKHVTWLSISIALVLAVVTNTVFHKIRLYIARKITSKNNLILFIRRHRDKIVMIILYFIGYTIFIASLDVLEDNQKINQELIQNKSQLNDLSKKQEKNIKKIEDLLTSLKVTQKTFESLRINLIENPKTTVTSQERKSYQRAIQNLNTEINKHENSECKIIYKNIIRKTNSSKLVYLEDIIKKVENSCSLINLKYAYLVSKLENRNKKTTNLIENHLLKAMNINKGYGVKHPQILHELAVLYLKKEDFEKALFYLNETRHATSRLNSLKSEISFRHPSEKYHRNLILQLNSLKKTRESLKNFDIIK